MKENIVKRALRSIVRKSGLTSAGFLLGNSPVQNFSNHWYIRHNQRRQEHLASLGLEIHGKSVLETGAGVGDHSTFFIDRNCDLTISEPREENLAILRERYPDNKIVKIDLDFPSDNFTKAFDIVYCYGTLYHLSNPAKALSYLGDKCDGMLLLETCVSFGDEESEFFIDEPKDTPTQAVSGIGCRPSRLWIYNQLKLKFNHVYIPVTQPSHPEFPLNWNVPNTNALNRAVFIASKKPLNNPLLKESLIAEQTYF